MEKINILIVDDHVLFSQALKRLIEDDEVFNVIGQLSNGQELQEYFNKEAPLEPDIILMDIQMPVVNGIEATKWIKENYPKIKVLALTMEDDEVTILRMIGAGAKGYLLKDIHPTVLHEAIKTTNMIGFYYTEQVTDTLLHASEIETKLLPKVELTDREVQLLQLLTQELTYKEIAEQMNLSHKTIDGYRGNLFSKLDVKSRVGLVLYAVKEGLV